jgi:hypothetical protein
LLGHGLLGRQIAALRRPVFGGPCDEAGGQAAGARGMQVVVVGGHHHDLRGRQVELPTHTEVGVRVRLVALEVLGREDQVPGQTGALGHVRQQRDVAVGQRADQVAPLQPRQAGHAVGPRVQAVPGAVDVRALRRRHASQAEHRQQLAQAFVVQRVERPEADLAAAHALHLRLVARAPQVGQAQPVGVQPLRRPPGAEVARDAAAPVDHGAEGVEDDGLHGGHGHGGSCGMIGACMLRGARP